MSSVAVILPAAGKSSRYRDKNYKKPFAPMANRAVWLHTAEKFLSRGDTKQLILVISPDDLEHFNFKFSSNVAILGIQVVTGGAERADSIEKALARVESKIDLVCVHDAVRPCIVDEWIDKVYESAAESGAAILGVPVSATLKRVGPGNAIAETVARESLWEAQTPQVFRRELLFDAYAKRGQYQPTDDAQLVERLGKPVTVVKGSSMNIKITTQEDLRLAEAVLKVLPKPKFDRPAHPFENDDMWR